MCFSSGSESRDIIRRADLLRKRVPSRRGGVCVMDGIMHHYERLKRCMSVMDDIMNHYERLKLCMSVMDGIMHHYERLKLCMSGHGWYNEPL